MWRLLVDGDPVDGARNMALDRAIQLARQAGDVGPTLRLYRWLRPTVSLGRFQDAAGVDRDHCAAEGIDVVRRFTGGRGVLHDDEVTYAIVAGAADGVPWGRAASYRMLCGSLVEAYLLLDVEAALTPRPRGDGSSAACYLHATSADLSLGALKLSGSAQTWAADTVLQHGSFTISRDVAREAAVFRLSADEARRLAEETVTLSDVLRPAPRAEEIERAAIVGLERAFGVVLARGELTPGEVRRADELLAETSADTVPKRSGVRGSR